MRMLIAGLIGLCILSRAASAVEMTEVARWAEQCVTCHTPNAAVSRDGAAPNLVGLPAERFLQAIAEFRSGQRRNSVMNRLASGFNETEWAALAAYFAALRP